MVNNKESILNALMITAIGLLILLSCLFYIRFAMENPPSFDGALNLNVSRSLAEGKGYGSYYNGYKLFPIETQTNSPYVFPAAIAYYVSGISAFTSQIVSLIYMMIFSLGLYAVFRKLMTVTGAMLVVMLSLQTPGIAEFGMSGYGEIPAISYFLLSLIALYSSLEKDKSLHAFIGGILLGLSFLTKTVALLWIAPTILFFSAIVIFSRKKNSLILCICSGFIFPISCFELYRMTSLGSIGTYWKWWMDQFIEIASQSGVRSKLKDTAGLFTKAVTHAGLLAQQTNIKRPFLLLLWIIPAPVILNELYRMLRSKDIKSFFVLGSLAGISLAYIIWWLFITPTEQAWLRRILDGLVLQHVLAIYTAYILIKKLWSEFKDRNEGRSNSIQKKLKYSALFASLILIFTAAGFLSINGQVLTRSPKPSQGAIEESAIADIIRQLPSNAKIFGAGWWQAPVVALFSGRDIDNIETWDKKALSELPEKYLIFDGYALTLGSKKILELRSNFILEPLHESSSGAVYKIIKEKPLNTQYRNSNDKYKDHIALDAEEYPYIDGFFEREGNTRWASPHTRVLLWRTDQDHVAAEITIPEDIIGLTGNDKKLITFNLKSPNCVDKKIEIPNPGRYRIEAPINCPYNSEGTPFEITLSLNSRMDQKRITPDVRDLAFRIHTVELLKQRP